MLKHWTRLCTRIGRITWHAGKILYYTFWKTIDLVYQRDNQQMIFHSWLPDTWGNNLWQKTKSDVRIRGRIKPKLKKQTTTAACTLMEGQWTSQTTQGESFKSNLEAFSHENVFSWNFFLMKNIFSDQPSLVCAKLNSKYQIMNLNLSLPSVVFPYS